MHSIPYLASICGFFIFYTVKLKKHPSFFPFLFIAFVSTTLFVFGLFEKLPYGLTAINCLGIVLGGTGVLFLKKEKRQDFFGQILFPSFFFFAIGLVWIFWITRNVGLSHWDDFSHWYRICKMMYSENAFPTKPDLVFRTYPPGTSLFIYYMTKLMAFSADNCLFAQACINLSCCTAFFSFLRTDSHYKRSVYYASFFLVSAISVLLCSINVSTYSLLVDTTMPLIALGLVFFVYSSGKGSDIASFLLLLSGIGFLCLIKTAAILFTVVIVVTFGLTEKKRGRPTSKIIIQCSILLLYGVALPVLYNIHSNNIYKDTIETPQAFSIFRYTETFLNRYGKADIIRKFFSELFLIGKAIPQV